MKKQSSFRIFLSYLACYKFSILLFFLFVGIFACVFSLYTLELEPVKGVPEVFVIAGCGTGTPVFRRLQRKGIPFATGIVYENDLDFPAARLPGRELTREKSLAGAAEIF